MTKITYNVDEYDNDGNIIPVGHPDRKRNKINAQDATTIRSKYKAGNHTYATLAEEYGIKPQTVGQIIRGIIHRSTLRDDDDWPIYDQGEQIRVLKIKNDLLENRVKVMERQIWQLRNRLGFPASKCAPEIPPPFRRLKDGVDMLSNEQIDYWESAEGQNEITETIRIEEELAKEQIHAEV